MNLDKGTIEVYHAGTEIVELLILPEGWIIIIKK